MRLIPQVIQMSNNFVKKKLLGSHHTPVSFSTDSILIEQLGNLSEHAPDKPA